MDIQRLLTIKNVVDAKVSRFPFTGEWNDAFGEPQSTGIWFVFGESGSGKTSFILMLIKRLSSYANSILFESHEEGEVSTSLQESIRRIGLMDVKNIYIADESKSDMIDRIGRRRSANIIVIDSIEHSEFRDISEILSLKRMYPKKLFIFVGQASGSRPRSAIGESVLFIANQKIMVEGYRAYSRGRSIGPIGYCTIWEREAEKYWNK